jgi:dihydrofolate synthase/folylpolyglutamate synthase
MAGVFSIDDHDAALKFLDDRIGSGVKPGLDRIEGLLDFMADPHLTYPVIHVAGTNGKTTVTRLVSDVLGAHGLRVGSFTSPHLHAIEDRFQLSGSSISPEEFTEAVSQASWLVTEFEERSGEGVTYFELTAALAFSIFADAAVDVAVVEVGLGGRLDATNVVRAGVSVITGIAMDHMSYLGDSLAAIATEKAAILDQNGLLVTGPLPAAAEGSVTARVAETSSRWLRFGDDFGVESAVPAVGGWSVDLRGIYGDYEDLYLALHGRHQVDNFATSAAAAEAFLEGPLDLEATRAAAAAASSPGRIEVAGRSPLVILDGAHNEEGFAGLAQALSEEFPAMPWHLVVGMRGERDPADLLSPLRGLVERAIVTVPADPAALPQEAVGEGVRQALGIEPVVTTNVPEAVTKAVAEAGPQGGVVVCGSIYVVGEARALLIGDEDRSSGVHVRIEPPQFGEDPEDHWYE